MSAAAYVLAHRGEMISIDGASVRARIAAAPYSAEPADGGPAPLWEPTLTVEMGIKVRPGSRVQARGRNLIVDTVQVEIDHKILTTRRAP